MKREIVATVGMCGSGKSVAGERLEQLGFVKVYFGGLTIEEVKRRGLEVNEKNERAVREELRRTHGMGAFAVLSLPKIEALLRRGETGSDRRAVQLLRIQNSEGKVSGTACWSSPCSRPARSAMSAWRAGRNAR